MNKEIEAALMRAGKQIDALQRQAEELRLDAERFRWLRDNAGAWEVRRSTSETFRPKFYFSAYSTGYGGRTLDDAIDKAMNGANVAALSRTEAARAFAATARPKGASVR